MQGVAHAAGEDAHVQQGQDAAPDGGEVHVLEEEHAHSGDKGREQELQTAELYAVHGGGEVVDDKDMYGEARGAGQDQQVAGGEGEFTVDAQQIQRDHGQCHGDPDGEADLPLEEQTAYGNQHHIQRRQEAGLAAVGTGDHARLLEVGGHGQRRTAAQAAQPQLPVGGLFLGGGEDGLVLFQLVADDDDHQQRQHRDKVAAGVEGERADGVGAHILRYKGGTPDKGGQDGENHLPHLIVFHVSDVLSLFTLSLSVCRCAIGICAPDDAAGA